ncbi:DUF1328 domain-containing protein [Legionella maioricensis]|uniref:DUF1328 domain-containing protein n=1 Tax=Legionella maioricensis TaxID=2896528 RepID=A0A9X2CZ87_9GAMM|nr:DUF1328 domain-containing protein [Legionella maioricensis]MCL9683635.1 DUF1328 domain-containing protein [Legionella maioricensis]MCL9687657.1 DUF1328 domain-containing protein [Legionella maioricensis]
MLIGAFIFLILAVISSFFAFGRPKSTVTLLAKMIFYFSLALFFVLLFTSIYTSAPPLPDDKKLPI